MASVGQLTIAVRPHVPHGDTPFSDSPEISGTPKLINTDKLCDPVGYHDRVAVCGKVECRRLSNLTPIGSETTAHHSIECLRVVLTVNRLRGRLLPSHTLLPTMA